MNVLYAHVRKYLVIVIQGFSDDRACDVMILRPLREFPSTEIDTYVALNHLSTVSLPSLSDKVCIIMQFCFVILRILLTFLFRGEIRKWLLKIKAYWHMFVLVLTIILVVTVTTSSISNIYSEKCSTCSSRCYQAFLIGNFCSIAQCSLLTQTVLIT